MKKWFPSPLFSLCEKACRRYHTYRDIYAVKSMFFALVSSFVAQRGAGNSDAKPQSSEVSRIMEYVCDHLEEKLTLSVVAKTLFLQKDRLEAMLRGYTGLTFSAFLRNVRISKAISLLSTDKMISEIAYECGFGSLRTFNRVFASVTGCAPTTFRNIKKQPDGGQ